MSRTLVNKRIVAFALDFQMHSAHSSRLQQYDPLFDNWSCLSSGGKVQRVIIRRPDVTYAAFFTCPMS